jgi:hypothetical protein
VLRLRTLVAWQLLVWLLLLALLLLLLLLLALLVLSLLLLLLLKTHQLEVFDAGAKGWRVRTTEAVAADQLIIEYVGEVIGARQKAERMKAVSSGSNIYYLH